MCAGVRLAQSLLAGVTGSSSGVKCQVRRPVKAPLVLERGPLWPLGCGRGILSAPIHAVRSVGSGASSHQAHTCLLSSDELEYLGKQPTVSSVEGSHPEGESRLCRDTVLSSQLAWALLRDQLPLCPPPPPVTSCTLGREGRLDWLNHRPSSKALIHRSRSSWTPACLPRFSHITPQSLVRSGAKSPLPLRPSYSSRLPRTPSQASSAL